MIDYQATARALRWEWQNVEIFRLPHRCVLCPCSRCQIFFFWGGGHVPAEWPIAADECSGCCVVGDYQLNYASITSHWTRSSGLDWMTDCLAEVRDWHLVAADHTGRAPHTHTHTQCRRQRRGARACPGMSVGIITDRSATEMVSTWIDSSSSSSQLLAEHDVRHLVVSGSCVQCTRRRLSTINVQCTLIVDSRLRVTRSRYYPLVAAFVDVLVYMDVYIVWTVVIVSSISSSALCELVLNCVTCHVSCYSQQVAGYLYCMVVYVIVRVVKVIMFCTDCAAAAVAGIIIVIIIVALLSGNSNW